MLNRSSFFIREHVGFAKLSNTYDILDPQTQAQVGIAKEKPGTLIHILRFVIDKRMLPTKVFIYNGSNHEDESQLLFSIQRGFTLLRARIDICDRNARVVGWLKSKLFSIGGAFFIHDSEGNQIARVKGDWKGWNFKFLDKEEKEIGTITKKWSGLGKEFFTSADNYIISLNQEQSPAIALLLLAAGLAVDTVYKEK